MLGSDAARQRDRLFISHANPEENLLARWLALRLANEGFAAWSDQTDLLGGERFWANIETAIRDHSARFLLLLSKNSNHRQGVLDELEIALTVGKALKIERFVIPLWVDDLPSAEFNIRLKTLNAIPFQRWSAGLHELLKLLDAEAVPKNPAFDPIAVADWWRAEHNGRVLTVKESLLSNLFPLREFEISFAEFDLDFGVASSAIVQAFSGTPHRVRGAQVVSFLSQAMIERGLPSGVRLKRFDSYSYNGSRSSRPPWSYRDERQVLASLLNDAWRSLLQQRMLAVHQFSNSTAFYVKVGQLKNDRMDVRFPDGSSSWRLAAGRRGREIDGRTVGAFNWHFAISARATSTPVWSLCIRPHVLFSDDGETIWDSDSRLARKRRSFCKQWWNDHFRDRNLGAVQLLADGAPEFSLLRVEGEDVLRVASQPLLFDSPVSYAEATEDDDPNLLADDGTDVDEEDEDDQTY